MLGVTKGLTNWNSQKNNVERLMDNAAYTSAHPDDTLVLAGPPRAGDSIIENDTGWQSLMPIGMLQTFQITSQKPTQPLMAIGSGRSFFVSGKSQTTWRVGKLFANGRNLLRNLYHSAAAQGVEVSQFDDPVTSVDVTTNSWKKAYWTNLDSELFYIPFGMCAAFRDKAGDIMGAFYVELCMINGYTLGFTAGQNMIMEDVGGLCDRLFPIPLSALAAQPGVPRTTIDTIIGFGTVYRDAAPDPTTGNIDELIPDITYTPNPA